MELLGLTPPQLSIIDMLCLLTLFGNNYSIRKQELIHRGNEHHHLWDQFGITQY